MARFIPLRLFASQFFVGNALASDVLRGLDEAIRIGALAVVESKRLFVKVAKQVERFNRNVGAANGSFEKRPKVFDSVGMHVAAHVGFSVIDHVMDIIFVQAIVGAKRIAINSRTSFDVLADFAMKRTPFGVRNDHGSDFAVTLKQTHHSHFANVLISSGVGSSVLRHALRQFRAVHVPSLATDESLVHFDFAAKLGEASGLHGLADSVKEKPRALLGDPERAVNLVRTNPILCADNQPDSRQPLIKADRTIFHDGSKLDAEMLLTALANPNATGLNKRVPIIATARAGDDPIRPADRNHAAQRGIRIGEVFDSLKECFWECFVCHGKSIPQNGI